MLQINAANNKQSFGVRRPFRFKDPRTESLFKYMFPKKEVDKIDFSKKTPTIGDDISIYFSSFRKCVEGKIKTVLIAATPKQKQGDYMNSVVFDANTDVFKENDLSRMLDDLVQKVSKGREAEKKA